MSYRAVVILNFLCLGVINCSRNNLNSILFSGDYEFIDLTHPLNNPQHSLVVEQKVSFVFTNQIAGEGRSGGWYAENSFSAAEQGGTHIVAPYHLNATGAKVGNITVDKLILPLVIIDVSAKVNDNPNFILYKYHLGDIVNRVFEEPCMIIFKFGWSKYYDDGKKYLGIDSEDIINDYLKILNFPGVSAEVAEWIVSKKNIVGVGVDTVSVAPGTGVPLRQWQIEPKRILANAGIWAIESVQLDRYVPECGCTAVALPMKIAEGTGAPVRLVAICPKQKPLYSYQ